MTSRYLTAKDYHNNPLLGAAYLLAIVLGLTFWTKQITDPDLGWQLLGGAWILKHRAVPASDFINTFNPYWHDYHWLSQIVLFRIYELGGYDLLRFANGLLMGYLFKVLFDICVISSGKRISALFITVHIMASLLLISLVASIRPQVIAFTILAVVLRRLLQKRSLFEPPFLIFATVILVNIHVYWVFVPFLWFSYRLLPSFLGNRDTKRFDLLFLVLLSLTGFISPYGIRSYEVLWEYAFMPELLLRTILEFQSGLTVNLYAKCIIFAVFAVFVRTVKIKSALLHIGDILTITCGFILTVKSAKFLALLAVFSMPFLLKNSTKAISPYAPSIFKRESGPAKLVVYTVLLAAIYVAAVNFPFLPEKTADFSALYPERACRIIADKIKKPFNSQRDHIRILTHFNQGGWCRWFAYQQCPEKDIRVTTDGRTQGVPEEQYKKSFELFSMKKGWIKTLNDWSPDAALVPASSSLSQGMALLGGWQIVFEDDNFRVFVPVKNN